MWLENLRKLRGNVPYAAIAKGTAQPERTVIRIFSGETKYPTISTIIPIVNFLGGSLDEVFSDTTAVVGGKTLAVMQEKVDLVTAENADLKVRLETLSAENKTLTTQLFEHKDELLTLHRQLNKLIAKN